MRPRSLPDVSTIEERLRAFAAGLVATVLHGGWTGTCLSRSSHPSFGLESLLAIDIY
ncbi:MAG: hypothetical protein ACJAYU_004272 [Bradymonadia bacterium]|jgi:hypothetical protein